MIKKVVMFNLPLSVKGYCLDTPDGSKVCVLNCRYTKEMNQETFLHELAHIHDVGDLDVDSLEALRHNC